MSGGPAMGRKEANESTTQRTKEASTNGRMLQRLIRFSNGSNKIKESWAVTTHSIMKPIILVPKLSKPGIDLVYYFTLKAIGNIQIK